MSILFLFKKIPIFSFFDLIMIGSIAVSQSIFAVAHAVANSRDELFSSRVMMVSFEAYKKFEKDFKSESGKDLTNEFIGFESQLYQNQSEAEYKVSMLTQLDSQKLSKKIYSCYSHENRHRLMSTLDVHCHNLNYSEIYSYSASERVFSIEEFKASATYVLKIYKDKIASPELIEAVQFWRSRNDIQVSTI